MVNLCLLNKLSTCSDQFWTDDLPTINNIKYIVFISFVWFLCIHRGTTAAPWQPHRRSGLATLPSVGAVP